MKQPKYEKEKCAECGQFKTYLLPIDRGTGIIVKAFATAVRRKGINLIHPTKEMEVQGKDWSYQRAVTEGVLTSTHIGNFTRARVHGLLAKARGNAGNWLLTAKGAAFLRDEPVDRFAIVQKSTEGRASHKQEYFEPGQHTVRLSQTAQEGEMWQGIDFEIVEGNVVLATETPKRKTLFT